MRLVIVGEFKEGVGEFVHARDEGFLYRLS